MAELAADIKELGDKIAALKVRRPSSWPRI